MLTYEPLYLIQDLAVILVSAIIAAGLCKSVNLSPVVGYLLAGIIVGTPQITFIYVTDTARIHLLSQLGLIFLMFTIGLSFRIQRFKQLGMGMVIACLCTALLTLTIARAVAGWIGLGADASLFFAAMLMVSSSAVIGKCLQSQGVTHQRFGQLALSITLCEDIVAIVLLTILGSYAAMDVESASSSLKLATQVGMLIGFITLLLLPGIIFVPRTLKRISRMRSDKEELQTLFVCAVLFAMALLTLLSGYSLALGSFLCGVLVAESKQSRQISGSFSGLKDLFAAVFFVAIGMSIDISLFGDAALLIAVGSALALALRPLAATLGLLLTCEEPVDATRAGLSLSPIGEFSFVIANLGVAAGVLEPRFQAAAVGIAFVTAILSPWIIQRNDGIANALNPGRLKWIGFGLSAYRKIWTGFSKRQKSSILLRLLKPRIPQIVAELLFVSAILAFSSPIYAQLAKYPPTMELLERGAYRISYWIVVAALALTPTIALARNLNAMSLLVGDALTQQLPHGSPAKRAIILLLRGLGLSFLALWLINLIPFSWIGPYGLAATLLCVLILIAVGWRRMVFLHSQATYSITQTVTTNNSSEEEELALDKARREWGIQLEETLLSSSGISGRSLADLEIRERTGATIVGIERQGHYLPSIGPNTHLFAGDRVFATGSMESLRKLRDLFAKDTETDLDDAIDYSAAILETVIVPEASECLGKSLKSLNWPRLLGVQVVAIRKKGEETRHAQASDLIEAGDLLLLVGVPSSLAAAKQALSTPGPRVN
ncbi:cation:proton antiporter [Pelagicoccus sp. SDUM812003]|uniref:cation:proton antiporter domain-containing protein n=1 Tax=Pelagicoccus sp. SDUM812003 TaxID=3041267 RepID=UPI00280D5432|nr:cation:proton antiporter [Pelagicoccus sp. SDUM812003]MDQ8202927.1 cation:proton antiporter [Pelagicoccus sp. SDUM812003]